MTTLARKARHPSAEGNLAFVLSRNKFPSIGGVPQHRAPRKHSLRGWFQGGVVRDYKNTHLLSILCHSRAGGNRVYKICIVGFVIIKT